MGKTAKRQNKRAAAAVLAVRGGLGGGVKRTKNIVTAVSEAAVTGAAGGGIAESEVSSCSLTANWACSPAHCSILPHATM
mgnify:CR=1 FL=1